MSCLRTDRALHLLYRPWLQQYRLKLRGLRVCVCVNGGRWCRCRRVCVCVCGHVSVYYLCAIRNVPCMHRCGRAYVDYKHTTNIPISQPCLMQRSPVQSMHSSLVHVLDNDVFVGTVQGPIRANVKFRACGRCAHALHSVLS